MIHSGEENWMERGGRKKGLAKERLERGPELVTDNVSILQYVEFKSATDFKMMQK